MKKNLRTLLIISIVLFQSCQSDDDLVDDTIHQDSKVVLNSNTTELNNRMDFSNSGVIALTASKLTSKKTASGVDNFPMSLLAEINPPTYEGKQLTASHVDINGHFVYVSYNTQGETYLGGIDVIDVSEPNNPKLVIQAVLPNTDISTVIYKDGILYISGAALMDANPELTSPAFVAKMPLHNGLLTDDYTSVSLVGNVGTGVAAAGSNYFAISGNNGSLSKINNSTNVINTAIPIADLRALGYNDNKVVVLSGSEGVKIYNADTMALLSTIVTSADVPDAKRTIDFQGSNLLVADGYSGLKVFNSAGNLLQTLTLPTTIEGIDPQDVVTNAVSVSGDYVYSANGAAGIAVYKNTNNNLISLGSIFLGGSANYVKSVGDYIFVATGTGGLKIIKKLTAAIDCTDFPTYKGGEWLNVNSGENLNYQGSASLQGINVNENLTFCGSLSVAQGVNVNSGGVFTMKGAMAQGNYNNPYASFNVNGTLKIDGSVVIYGNLVLNSGAKIEFTSGATITIYGSVIKNSGVTISGDYTDTMNKLKK